MWQRKAYLIFRFRGYGPLPEGEFELRLEKRHFDLTDAPRLDPYALTACKNIPGVRLEPNTGDIYALFVDEEDRMLFDLAC